MRDLNVLLIAIGSHGDVHPFVGLGLALRARGHDVTVVTNPHFEPLVRRVGLGFAPVGTAEEYKSMAADPDMWHPTRAFNVVARGVLAAVRPTYQAVVDRNLPGQTVVAASSLALGARVAQEAHDIPTATVHLQPGVMRSEYEVPRYVGMPMRTWMPRWWKRFMWGVSDKLFIDRALAGPMNEFRGGLGLPPAWGYFADWWNSPQLVLGLFPEWFAAKQPDWPKQMRLTGFPLYDEKDLAPMPPGLVDFLDRGAPPIAFTPGSAMWQGRAFFDAAVETCRRLGRRGVLLTRHRDHLPPSLPPDVIHADYAPFSQLLPRCAAIVHHGGMGTSAQSMAAGVPQLVTPMAHDQLDNAVRMERLGVARWLLVKKFKPNAAAALLGQLLSSPATADACRAVRQKFELASPLEETCDLLESLAPLQRAAPRPAAVA